MLNSNFKPTTRLNAQNKKFRSTVCNTFFTNKSHFFLNFRVIGVGGGWVETGFIFYFRVIGEEESGQRSKFLWKGWRKGDF